MKKTVFLAALLCYGTLWAQDSPSAPRRDCHISVHGSFESSCLYEDKQVLSDEYPDMIVACQSSTVVYTASAPASEGVTEYLWDITGATAVTTTGNQATVTWGDDTWGMMAVSAVYATGDTCIEGFMVKLSAVPQANSSTVPAYTPAGTVRILQLCAGDAVWFTDLSAGADDDIVGHVWMSRFHGSAGTTNFFIDSVLHDDTVVHRVYNSCGCFGEEVYLISVSYGQPLELDCYGTVCRGDRVTYTLEMPDSCKAYMWHVDGGVLVDGQCTPSPTVVWDSPQNGYGVLSLDGTVCGISSCHTLSGKKIPVIHDSLAIGGASTVCEGETAVYSIPQFGSTRYTWHISPTTGVATEQSPYSNDLRITFNSAGSYTLTVDYECPFLGCGPYSSLPLTVTVKPKLTIEGADRLCVAGTCRLSTSAAAMVDWTVYDSPSGDGDVLYSLHDSVLSYVFPHAGRFLVTASDSAYCRPATMLMRVEPAPPAPSIADLAPSNRHYACYNGGLTLAGHPSRPDYSLVWRQDCLGPSPQEYSGDSVTINYNGTICDVLVYNYDRVLGCLSNSAYRHTVQPLTLAPLALPSSLLVCPGSTIVFDDTHVPDQSADGVLYEWSIDNLHQYCASLQGTHLSNTADILVNEVATPQTFSVNLKRTYCYDFSATGSVAITVDDYSTSALLSIAGPDTVCVDQEVVFTGSGGIQPNRYRWTANGATASGSSLTTSFPQPRTEVVKLTYNPFDVCPDASSYIPSATKNVAVMPPPEVYDIVISGSNVSVSPVPSAPGYSYTWSYTPAGGTPSPVAGNSSSIAYQGQGNYLCQVTSPHGCTVLLSKYLPRQPGQGCLSLNISTGYDVCTNTLTFSTTPNNGLVGWIFTDNLQATYSGTNHNVASVHPTDVGLIEANATIFIPRCYQGWASALVDFIPAFSLRRECNDVYIVNSSKYLNPAALVHVRITSQSNPSVCDTVSFPVSNMEYMVNTVSLSLFGGTFTFELIGYGSLFYQSPCTIGSIWTPGIVLPIPIIDITTANTLSPNNTCDNTPIELTATCSGYTIVSSAWQFGDGSSYTASGNSVFHTFMDRPTQYSVSVILTDSYGCQHPSGSFSITSNSNLINSSNLIPLQTAKCSNGINYIDNKFNPSTSICLYHWSDPGQPIATDYINPHQTYYSGEYKVRAITQYYCHHEANDFVRFLNKPTASIYSDRLSCCVGEPLRLYGENGPSPSAFSYQWVVTGPGYSRLYSTPNIDFSGPWPGTYTAKLFVSDTGSTCSDSAQTTITVSSPPPSPAITPAGLPCAQDAPVELVASGYSGEMHWSNGDTGLAAYYFTAGMAEGWYFDPAVGCPSLKAHQRIFGQPDFDALLTGCYRRCKSAAADTLEVFGLVYDTTYYSWLRDNSETAHGYTGYTYPPLRLPIAGLGTYRLETTTGPCQSISPKLTIDPAGECACDSVEVDCRIVMFKEGCQPIYIVEVTLHNTAAVQRFCFERPMLYPEYSGLVSITGSDWTGTTLYPGDSLVFHIELQQLSPRPATVALALQDRYCSGCLLTFSVRLEADVPCHDDIDAYIKVNTQLTNDHAAYYDIDLYHDSRCRTVAAWSEPPMLVDYVATTAGTVHALGMFDMAVLSQMAESHDSVCFYVLVCCNDSLCRMEHCVEVDSLLAILHRQPGMMMPSGRGEALPRLVPNPAVGEVAVADVDGRVAEMLLMDMHGRRLMAIQDSDRLDTRGLTAGAYIVRVRVVDAHGGGQVHYLKLIKR